MPIPPWEQKNNELALIDPVHNLNTALLPSIRNALLRGDLQFALNAIAATNNGDRVRQIAATLAENVGTTKVEVVDSVTELLGKRAVGFFEPETNTIYIDVNGGTQSRLVYANRMLEENEINLGAASSRIMDADMAYESTKMAQQNVLLQAGASMVTQANQLSNIVLSLLQ